MNPVDLRLWDFLVSVNVAGVGNAAGSSNTDQYLAILV